MKATPYIFDISQGVVKEMAGSIHTPTSCLSKLRSSLEVGFVTSQIYGYEAMNMRSFSMHQIVL